MEARTDGAASPLATGWLICSHAAATRQPSIHEDVTDDYLSVSAMLGGRQSRADNGPAFIRSRGESSLSERD